MKTVLIVDDEEILRFTFKEFLEEDGYVVETAENYDDAMEKLRASSFDLVITDMTMPGMTGAHLSEEIYKIRPDIPVILCTGFSELIDQEEAGKFLITEFHRQMRNNPTTQYLIRRAAGTG